MTKCNASLHHRLIVGGALTTGLSRTVFQLHTDAIFDIRDLFKPIYLDSIKQHFWFAKKNLLALLKIILHALRVLLDHSSGDNGFYYRKVLQTHMMWLQDDTKTCEQPKYSSARSVE